MAFVCSEIDRAKLFLTLTFKLLGRNIAPLHFKTHRVAETALRASWFWPTLAIFPGSWGIFSSPMDSKVTVDGLGLQWKGHSKIFWTLPFELLGRNRAPLHFMTHKVAETALRASWFWPTSGIFSSPGDSTLTPDGLRLQWNGHSKIFWTLPFELLGRNIARVHFKTKRVAETALRASWYWPTSARFSGT